MPIMIHVKWCPVCDGIYRDKATGAMVPYGNVPTGKVVMPYTCKCGYKGQIYEACFNEGAPA